MKKIYVEVYTEDWKFVGFVDGLIYIPQTHTLYLLMHGRKLPVEGVTKDMWGKILDYIPHQGVVINTKKEMVAVIDL